MSPELKEKLIAYYTKYYRDICSLPDYTVRVENRLHEEDQDLKRLQKLEQILNLDFRGKKHCIVGAGTGGLAIVLHQHYQAEVFGLEPSAEELQIIKLKCREQGLNPNNFTAGVGEKISAPDQTFDFVFCITVLEHVQDVEQCLKEMIRITKPGGKIYINTPNYAYPYEGHYKIHLPLWSRTLSRLILRLKGKSDQFLTTINLFTASEIDALLMKIKNIRWQRIYESPSVSHGGGQTWLLNYLKFKKGIYPGQEIIITKL